MRDDPANPAHYKSLSPEPIEVPARVAERIFADGWPLTHKAFCENGRVGP
jgi:hypothetical protein